MPSAMNGELMKFTQPDGTQFNARIFGNQYHAVLETPDGYTIVKDPSTGFFHLATLNSAATALKPMGVHVDAVSPASLGLSKGIRVLPEAARSRVSIAMEGNRSRWRVRREEHRASLHLAVAAPGIVAAPPPRQTMGTYAGLCVLVKFPDVDETISRQQVTNFCNLQGYTEFGNNGSVFDYFSDNSEGKLQYTNIVTPYYTAANNRDYYTDPAPPFGDRARELIEEALTCFKSNGLDFSKLTNDNAGYVYAVNVFYAGDCVNNWSEGLWPHSSSLLAPFALLPGKSAFDYQITNMGSSLSIGTFCHENGHMICDFPDLYNYHDETFGVGDYCLMGYGPNQNELNPTQICAYLKFKAGWTSKMTQVVPGLNASIVAGKNDFYMYRRNPAEYFIVENRSQTGRDSSLTDSGLAIWHVDERGDNTARVSQSIPECALEQADGRFDLEHHQNVGDGTDLYPEGANNELSGTTVPDSNWFDGTASGLAIKNIGPVGPTMTFSA